MDVLFYINTGNRFNQVLIFTSYTDAVSWCKVATRWTDEEISARIKRTEKNRDGSFSVIPNQGQGGAA